MRPYFAVCICLAAISIAMTACSNKEHTLTECEICDRSTNKCKPFDVYKGFNVTDGRIQIYIESQGKFGIYGLPSDGMSCEIAPMRNNAFDCRSELILEHPGLQTIITYDGNKNFNWISSGGNSNLKCLVK